MCKFQGELKACRPDFFVNKYWKYAGQGDFQTVIVYFYKTRYFHTNRGREALGRVYSGAGARGQMGGHGVAVPPPGNERPLHQVPGTRPPWRGPGVERHGRSPIAPNHNDEKFTSLNKYNFDNVLYLCIKLIL